MFDLPFDLRRASGFVRTVMGRFSFRTHQGCATFRTGTDKTDLVAYQQTTSLDTYADNLRNNLATFFHKHTISQMQVEPLDNICIVKRCTLYNRAGQQDRLQVGYRSNGSCPPDLERDGVKTCHCTFGLKLIGNRPTRVLGCKSQIALLAQ